MVPSKARVGSACEQEDGQMGANALQVAKALFSELCLLLPTRQRSLHYAAATPTLRTHLEDLSQGGKFWCHHHKFRTSCFYRRPQDPARFSTSTVEPFCRLFCGFFCFWNTLLELSLLPVCHFPLSEASSWMAQCCSPLTITADRGQRSVVKDSLPVVKDSLPVVKDLLPVACAGAS